MLTLYGCITRRLSRCNGVSVQRDSTLVTSTKALPGEVCAITVDVDRWRSALPETAWPEGFAADSKVWRQDVFDVAERWRRGEATALQLAAASLAWGLGITGYGRRRTRDVLDQDPDGSRLAISIEGLRDERPTEADLLDAYERLFRGVGHVRGLGPAFFTKIIYFAGYRRGVGGLQPLILDKVVAERLPDDAGGANRHESGWWPSTWRDYLYWAAKQAERPAYCGEPDHVEMDLFNGVWTP